MSTKPPTAWSATGRQTHGQGSGAAVSRFQGECAGRCIQETHLLENVLIAMVLVHRRASSDRVFGDTAHRRNGRRSRRQALTWIPAQSSDSKDGYVLLAPAVVMVNQSAPAGKLGAVNGAGQMVASAVRGAAPALCGFVWAATLGLEV